MRSWIFGIICFAVVGIHSVVFAQQSFYSIHISSHKQQEKAVAEVKKVNARGLEAFYRHVDVQGKGKWYRIFVGKYATREEATREANRLKKMEVSKYFSIKQLVEEKPVAAETAVAAAAKRPQPSAKAAPAATRPLNYYLFVGFFRDLDPAQNEVTRLNKALTPYGYSAVLTRETLADGMMYRVYIGTFSDRQAAAASGAELKGKKILTSFYIPVQTPQDMIAGRMPEPTPATDQKSVAASAAAQPAAAGSTSTTAKKTPAAKPEKEPVAKTAARQPVARDFSRFNLLLKGGAYSPQNVNKFAITDLGAATVYRISDEAAPLIGLEGAVHFNRTIGLYGNADAVFISGINWYNFSAGPILKFQASDSVMPYLKGGAVYGNFSWDDVPGKFDSSVGWEVGTGLNFMKSNFKIGIDFNYRNLSFDYKAPNDPLVSATEDSLDMTGFSLAATISFWF